MHATGPLPAAIESALAERFELVPDPAGADGILALITTRVDDPYLAAAGAQLKVVANYGVGVDNIDLAAAQARDIVVANTPDVLTETTAELAIALTLALLRRVAEGDRFVRSRKPWGFSLEFMLGEGLREGASASSARGASAVRRATSRRHSEPRRSTPAAATTSAPCSRPQTS